MQNAPVNSALMRKVSWRLIPFMMLLYFVAFLDRVNIGFAALTMNADLGFSATVFGAGAGIFFLGYVLFEIPSNLALEKFGARRWIARIMFTWGLISCAMAFVQGSVSFYVMRFILGMAEAGFFPGMILYLTYWFPAAMRAKIVSLFFIAVPLSTVIGAPLSTLILGLDAYGLKSWQWLFLIEGVPALVLAFVVLRYLTDRPATAHWLTDDEKRQMETLMAADRTGPRAHNLRAAFADMRLWIFGGVYFGITVGIYGLSFWLPQMVQSLGILTTFQIGLLTAAPYVVVSVTMYLWGRHSDKTGERVWHVVLPAWTGAAAFLASAALLDAPMLAYGAIVIAASGVFAAVPAFWSLPTALLGSTAAAGGIALVNSVGNLGGYLGPLIVGYFRDVEQSYATGLVAMGGFIFLTGVLALVGGSRA